MGNGDWGTEIENGWFDPVKHIYRDERGTIIPSVTQIFDLLHLVDFSAISPDVLEWKRQFGTSVHKAVELLVQADLDWDSCDERSIPAITGVEQAFKKLQYKSEVVEDSRIFNLFGMKYGGSCDHRGTCVYQGQERHCVIDLKTASKEEFYWKWQVSAYTAGLPKNSKPWLGMVLKVDKEGNVTPYYYDVYAGLKEFQCLLATAILGINNGAYKLKK
jgi:hypothetical protein